MSSPSPATDTSSWKDNIDTDFGIRDTKSVPEYVNRVKNPLIRHAANYTKKQATEEDIGHTT